MPLCDTCRAIKISQLSTKEGQVHKNNIVNLRLSAQTCLLCALLVSSIRTVNLDNGKAIYLCGRWKRDTVVLEGVGTKNEKVMGGGLLGINVPSETRVNEGIP